MADRPLKALKWKTPLEVAHKPSLDQIAKTGINGIMDIISPGIPPGSDTATLALLGYDPVKFYSGRGAMEALGSNIEVSDGDVALRCNFATVDDNLVILDRRADRIASEEAAKIAESLQKVKLDKALAVGFLFKNTVQHRAVLLLRGKKLSTAVSDSDPGKVDVKISEIRPLDNSMEARRTAKILNELMARFREVLKNHPVNVERVKKGKPPANAILCRGAGVVPKVRSIKAIYDLNGVCVAATSLVRGVCRAAGMKLVDVKGATGTLQTDYMAKAKIAVQMLKKNDFVLLHVKAPDVASHDGKIGQKIEVIEKIDMMVGYLLENVDLEKTVLAVTTDHTTSSFTRTHEGDPVPIAVSGFGVRADDVEVFDERACAKGGLHRIRGVDLMPILMSLLGRTKKFGF